jgi:3-hydroxymyristoyl/3-hydroxydecanoyl-(acyl carrier protein) dehydratase
VLGAWGNISPGAFILSVAIAAAVSMAVFWHASKNGNKHATAWGIATFLFAGIILPVCVIYFLMTRRRY